MLHVRYYMHSIACAELFADVFVGLVHKYSGNFQNRCLLSVILKKISIHTSTLVNKSLTK